MDDSRVLRIAPKCIAYDAAMPMPKELKNYVLLFPDDFTSGWVFFFEFTALAPTPDSGATNDLQLERAEVLCPYGNPMKYRSVKSRRVKNASMVKSCLVMVPRFYCSCEDCKKMKRRYRMMYPPFLYGRKRLSIPAIQQIVSYDSSEDINKRRYIYDMAGSSVHNSRRWVCDIIDEIFLLRQENERPSWYKGRPQKVLLPIYKEETKSEERKRERLASQMLCEAERELIRLCEKELGSNWLVDLFYKHHGIEKRGNLSPLYDTEMLYP